MKTLVVPRILLILVAVLVMTSAGATPARAEAPEQTKIHLDMWYVIGPAPNGPCSFSINVHETGMLQDKKWYDNNGNLEKETLQYGGNQYDYIANGKTATVQNSGHLTITYPAPNQALVTESGQQWVWKMPGYGKISGETGNESYLIVYDDQGNVLETIRLKLVGNMLSADVAPILCDYLKP